MQNQTTHHKGKQEDRQVGRHVGRQEGRPTERQIGKQGRQNRGKADIPSNTEHYRHTYGKRMGNKGRQDLGKWDIPSNTGIHVGKQWETKGDKTSGRRAQHPTQAHVWETMGDMRR